MVLSIIVPIYNVEKYIEECLDSLVNQDIDKNEYEIICVDDKSTDNSAEIVEDYIKSYANIKLIRLKENKGVSSARNAGIEVATGDYVWFIDSDDFIAYNVLGSIASKLKETNADTVFVLPKSFKDGEDTQKFKCSAVQPDDTTKTYEFWLWTRIIKRKIVVKNNVKFNPKVYYAEDKLFACVLELYVQSTARYDMVCYFYRHRNGSLMSTPLETRLNQNIYCAKYLLDFEKSNDVYEKVKHCVYSYVITVVYQISRMSKGNADNWLRKLKELKLFPLEEYNYQFFSCNANCNREERELVDLKNKCYTEKGYRKLRAFRFRLRIKRRLKSIFKKQ